MGSYSTGTEPGRELLDSGYMTPCLTLWILLRYEKFSGSANERVLAQNRPTSPHRLLNAYVLPEGKTLARERRGRLVDSWYPHGHGT